MMLAEVRRRRRFRRARPLLMMAACLTVAVTLLCLLPMRETPSPASASTLLVRSVPLRPEQIVTTARHTPNIVTVRSGKIELMTASLDVIRTFGELPSTALTDEQLLDLFNGRAVALVTFTTGKRLVFLDQEPQPDSVQP